MFLYESIDMAKVYGQYRELPRYITEGLNKNFELRPYQEAAFRNFVTYFESALKKSPSQTLFHMATGSGKTLIMAGLMLYLYKQGYRNFLFFVNLGNIVVKTKENFLNRASSKYLFADKIVIDGETVKIKEAENFQNSDPDAVNVCFTTTQGLHSDIWTSKENALTFDDFTDRKTVFISDEAHHINAVTKNKTAHEEEIERSWEKTVERIFKSNPNNVLLEFTATCDLQNADILSKYEDKIIFDYPLRKFREDKYSKEIKTLRSDVSVQNRALQALLLSQYRLKVFQEHKINVKPVVLFKSHRIKENAQNMEDIIKCVSSVTGDKLKEVIDGIKDRSPVMRQACDYFVSRAVSYDQLAQELKEDFSESRCLSANDDKEVERNQILLNSLEDAKNPYRAVFAVDKLNEGWDVLNLFDIVRLYETRDGKDGKPGAGTVSEAQLIGRGARYCPFRAEPDQPKYQRKYDDDISSPLRICETLYYHCWNEPRYVSELRTALREVGLDADDKTVLEYKLKSKFKNDDIYANGYVLVNGLTVKNHVLNSLPCSVKDKVYSVFFALGKGGEDTVMEEVSVLDRAEQYVYRCTFSGIAKINYNSVEKALRRFPVLRFDNLKKRFAKLSSTRQFIEDGNYLGNVKLEITSEYEKPSAEVLYKACVKVAEEIAQSFGSIGETYEGTEQFKLEKIRDIITDKSVQFGETVSGGKGVSQSDVSVIDRDRMDLSKEDWYAFNDNYGTDEEKAFVAYFKTFVPSLRKKYDKVYLVRNERQLVLYSFEDGGRFEPDFLVLLRKNKPNGAFEQKICFVEPKGENLIEKDKWKEDFLLEIERKVPRVETDGNVYKAVGLHFFNREKRMKEFAEDMEKL